MKTVAEMALDDLLETGAVMAQELTERADELLEISGDPADVYWLRALVERWEAPYKIYHQEISR